MPQKIYLNILRIGVYISLLSVFLVFRNLLFPYITSKQIFFNILVEILFVFWAVFIIKYPEYRPKKSYLTYGLFAFFAAMLASLFVTVDINLSFWGDIERMLGIFHLLHFLAFYLIIITVFRRWSDWKILFIISIVFAIFESIKCLTGNNTFGTIGNTAYVSAYLIFNLYFCLLIFFREHNKILRWVYLAPIVIILFAFKAADTTGAYVGLGASFMFMFLLYGILSKDKRIKIATWACFGLLAAAAVLLLINKNSAFVRGNNVLNFASQISLQKNTFQTRLISWRAAAKDFKQHPILGVGWGNYAVIFDKYFDPKFYNYTESETYFDRAHNNLIDIGSTTGLVGLLAYLSIFAALAYYLINGYRAGKISLHEFALISSLIVAYFVQNLAVFDSLVTYMGLMMTLGFVYWFSNPQNENVRISDEPFINKEIYVFAGLSLVIAVIMWQYNIKVYKMLDLTIQGQMYNSQGNIDGMIEAYKKALAYDTVLDRDSRTSLNRVIVSNPDQLAKLPSEKRQEILDYNIELGKKNVAYNENDSLNQMLLAQLLNVAASFNSDDPSRFSFYSDQSVAAIDKSIAASPGRTPIYFQKAQIYITRGEQDKVIEVLKSAVSLNEKYRDAQCYLAKTLFFYKQEEEGYKYIGNCIDLGMPSSFFQAGFVQGLINYYTEKKDWPRVTNLFERLIALEPQNVKYMTALAKLYADLGDKASAKLTAEKAIAADPSIKQYADDFIKGLGL